MAVLSELTSLLAARQELSSADVQEAAGHTDPLEAVLCEDALRGKVLEAHGCLEPVQE